MKINSLFNVPGSRKPRKRICRGNGSGTGRTGGRGERDRSRALVLLSKLKEARCRLSKGCRRGVLIVLSL
jgi:ribosomal protein L15